MLVIILEYNLPDDFFTVYNEWLRKINEKLIKNRFKIVPGVFHFNRIAE